MTIRLTMTAVLALCGLMVVTGCYNPLKEKLYTKRSLEAGDYVSATERAEVLVDHDPSDWERHFLLGKAYLGLGRGLEAQTELEQALAVQNRSASETPKILDAIAESLHMQNKYEELYAFLDAQIKRYEGWQDYARKGRFLSKANDVDGAALAYRQAADLSRNRSADLYVEMADFYEDRGNYEKAVQVLKWAYFIDDQRTDLRAKFERLGYVYGPSLKEQPPAPSTPK